MPRIKNTSDIRVYELNKNKVNGTLTVNSHPYNKDLVILTIQENQKITILSSDLIMAINNCVNVGE
jgi:hypothetical protein